MPTDPYSLPQAYQRWLYRFYAHAWTLQTTATRQTYATAGSRFHLTAFQYWMRVMLKTMPDIIAIYYLDDNTHPTTPDISGKGNTLTVFGASPASGVISGCFDFDGINDYLEAPSALIPSGDFSVLSTINPTAVAGDRSIVSQYIAAQPGRLLWRLQGGNGKQEFYLETQGGVSNTAVGPGWHRLAITRLSNTLTWYKDGQPDGTVAITLSPSTTLKTSVTGLHNPFEGRQDHIWLFNRGLAQTEVALFSDLHYPPGKPLP